MRCYLAICLLVAYLGTAIAGDDLNCECRYDDCLDNDTNEGDCRIGYSTGTKCCWESEPDCMCKEFCNTDERRLRTCGDHGQYGYCCKYPRRRYN